MSTYRLNKYLVIKDLGAGCKCIFNSFNFETVKITDAAYTKLTEKIKEGSIDWHKDADKVLLDKKILVDNDFDEERMVEYKFLKVNHSDEVLELLIMPTLKCNFRCLYCYEKHEDTDMTEEVQNAVITFVRKKMKEYGSLHVSWFGGEPLLRMDIIEKLSEAFIQVCKENKKTYFADMTTNGYLLSYEKLKMLKRLKVISFQITVDGTREFHDKQRVLAGGAETFERIISNLNEIKEKDRSKFLFFQIRMNLTKLNLINKAEFQTFFSETFGDDPRFMKIETCAWPGNDENKDNYLIEEEKLLYFSGPTVKLLENIRDDEEEIARFKVERVRKIMVPCKCARGNHFGIDPNGKIFMCEAHIDDERVKVGILDKSGNMKFDECAYSKWVTKKYNKKCLECEIQPICLSSSCPYKIGILNSDKLCEEMKVSVDYVISKISANMYLCPEIFEV